MHRVGVDDEPARDVDPRRLVELHPLDGWLGREPCPVDEISLTGRGHAPDASDPTASGGRTRVEHGTVNTAMIAQ